MVKMSAADAKNRFGEMLDRAQHEAVAIEKHGRPIAVMLSQHDYEDLQAAKLALLKIEIEKGLADVTAGRVVDGEAAIHGIRKRLEL